MTPEGMDRMDRISTVFGEGHELESSHVLSPPLSSRKSFAALALKFADLLSSSPFILAS